MATPAIGAPPSPPPGVTGQMGAGPNPMAGIAQMLAQRGQQQPGQQPAPGAGAISPQGALLAMQSGVEKVLKQMAQMSEAFAPFADRAIAIVEAGVAAVGQGGTPQGPQAPAGDSGATGTAPIQSAAPMNSKTFPG